MKSLKSSENSMSSNLHRAQEDEIHLINRYEKACESARQSNKFKLLKGFENHVDENKTVCINMRASTLRNLLQDERVRYINLHSNLDAGAVEDYDSGKYQKRLLIDIFIFGPDYKNIVFGALNVGNCGLISYGEYCVVLKTEDIKERTSFLEKNSFQYVLDFSRTTLHIEVPDGSRALWSTVSKLCVVKHVQDILQKEHLNPSQIADMVLRSTEQKQDDDFIEVQVLRPIGISNIARVIRCVENHTITSGAVEIASLDCRIISLLLRERGISLEQKNARQNEQDE